MHKRITATALIAAALRGLPAAQGAGFETPGMPVYPEQGPPADSGQTDRFSSVFNPAFSFIVDTALDYVDPGSSSEDDGFAAHLRVFELAGNAWVDPDAWAYFVGAADEESVNLEEAAIHYVGLGPHNTLRAGRFFIDFGKEMQTHVHELRTLERPLVLRAYLGEEAKGDGAQWDCWTTVGEATVVRWSIGAFTDLLPEESEFPSLDPSGEPLVQEVADRKDLGDLNFTARLTGFRDVGEQGVLQLGASVRALPSFSLTDETNGLAEEDLSNEVFGADVTYGWTGETGLNRLTLGGEWLTSRGDSAALVDDPDATPGTGDETLDVLDDSLMGWFAYGDYAWNRFNSAGLQFSAAELPDGSATDAREIEAYYTHMFSELHRLRLSVTSADLDDTGDDELRIALQYTAILGAHGHGVSF
jgi:hypothetical protein